MHQRILHMFSALAAAVIGHAADSVRVEPAAAAEPAVTVLPFQNTDGTLARLGSVAGPEGQTLAVVSGAWSPQHLRIQIEVQDADHVPANAARQLWSTDSVEIGFDLAGDGSGSLPVQTTGVIGEDDLKVIVGQAEDGPRLMILASKGIAAPKQVSELLLAGLQIARDAQRPETMVYRFDLPWSAIGQVGGSRPVVGLDVQVNDRDAGQQDKTPFQWGGGLKGGFTAAAMQRFALGAPPVGFIAASWDPLMAWSATDRGVLRIGLHSDAAIEAKLGILGSLQPVLLPAGSGFRFFTVSIPAQEDGTQVSFELPGKSPVTAAQTAPIGLYAALQEQLRSLAGRPGQHPLFVRHLDSLHALVVSDWARTLINRTTDPRRADESIVAMRQLLAGLAGESGDWKAYLDGRRSLIMSYVSPHDNTLQYYFFGLPRDWDASKSYPLFFELHGAGSDHPLGGPASRLGIEAKAVALHGYDTPRVWAEIDRSGYWVHPFGRGNLGYAGIARIDVLEAYEHAHQLVKIDADRRYLYGFSMGGMGTLALSQLTPSRWAACAAMAGAGMRGEPIRTYMIDNLIGMPYRMVIGANDGGLANFRAMRDAMQARGLQPLYSEIPELGHMYTADMQRESGEWLKTHVRKRPSRFTFATADNLTSDCWGVRLFIDQGIALRGGNMRGPLRVVDESAQIWAKATVAISGQTVTVDTVGANQVGLDFDLVDGLGLQGDVVVIWNGKEAYRGPAKPTVLR